MIAFGGRTTVGDSAKYKNSGATSLFDKSGVLFGLDHARDAIKDKRQAVIVEGYMDALCLWQEGFNHVVASMGTALTVRQLKLLYQQTKVSEVVILFDGDNPGQKATLDAIDVVLEVPELRVRAARLQGGDDPDTFVRKSGSDALRAVLDHAVDLIDVAIGAKLKGASPASIPSIVSKEFIPWLSKIQDPIKRGYLLNRISGLTGVPPEAIFRQLKSFQFGSANGQYPTNRIALGQESSASSAIEAEASMAMPARALTPIEKGILGHLYFAQAGEIDAGKVEAFVAKELVLEPLWDHFARQIAQSYEKGLSPREDPGVMAAFSPDEAIVLGAITEMPLESFATADRKKSIERLIIEQKRHNIQQSISLLKRQVQIASSQSPQDVSGFLSEVMALTSSLTVLDRTLSEQ